VGGVEVEHFPKWSRTVLFGVNPVSNHIDVQVKEEHSCLLWGEPGLRQVGVGFMGLVSVVGVCVG
jgi:hypothetical protein